MREVGTRRSAGQIAQWRVIAKRDLAASRGRGNRSRKNDRDWLAPRGKELPELPSSGLNSVEAAERLNVVAEINTTGMTYFVPGPDPSIYAYVHSEISSESL